MRNEIQHDEINLFRLVRRLEKSVFQSLDVWEVQPDAHPNSRPNSRRDVRLEVEVKAEEKENAEEKAKAVEEKAKAEEKANRKPDELRVKAHKELQKVKYARKLVKGVEGFERGSSERTRRIGAVKIALDRVEVFLKGIEAKHRSVPIHGPSVLDQLPLPLRDESAVPQTPSENTPSDVVREGDGEGEGERDEEDQTSTPKAIPAALSLEGVDNFLLSPPDEYPPGLPSSGLVSALPALMSAVEPLDVPPAYRPSSASTSTTALSPQGVGGLTHRHPTTTPSHPEATTSLHTELSSQLELMAAQLKRNALHFADALEKDKVVVEGALVKVEGNLGFMETQRGRLRDLAGKSGGTTWLTVGIVVVVLGLFVVMVGFIRVTRV